MQRLPECRQVIEAAESPMALWIELLGACEEACKKQEDDLVRRFYDFARWCWQSPNGDTRTAVTCAFYEHLPTTPVLRRDMPRHLGRAAFGELREVLRYHLSPEEAAGFEQEFLAGEQNFVMNAL